MCSEFKSKPLEGTQSTVNLSKIKYRSQPIMERNGTHKMVSINKIISGPFMARLKQSLSMPARASQGREKTRSVFKEAPWRKYVFTKGRALGTQRTMSWLREDPAMPSRAQLREPAHFSSEMMLSPVQVLLLDAPPSTDGGHWPQWAGSMGSLNDCLCI